MSQSSNHNQQADSVDSGSENTGQNSRNKGLQHFLQQFMNNQSNLQQNVRQQRSNEHSYDEQDEEEEEQDEEGPEVDAGQNFKTSSFSFIRKSLTENLDLGGKKQQRSMQKN